jgi:hypothetical protein
MTACADYHHIECDIADISQTINKQQIYVNGLITQRTNNAYQYDAYVTGQQLILNRLIKQKNELCNKLQHVHEERYNEFNKSNALSGVSDVMNIAFQYAHPKDIQSNKYVVEKRVKSARSQSPGRNNDNNNYREYKKDKFERFLDFLTTNLKILRFICLIVFIIIKFVYIFSYIYIKLLGIANGID